MIVPGGVQGLDRYAYTFNNPIKYKDPSGHSGCKDKHVAEGDCSDSSLTDILKEVYEVTLKRGTGDFSEEEIRAIYRGVQSVDNKLRDQVNGLVTGETFKEYFGSTTFLKGNRGAPGLSGECMGIDSGGCTSNANLINFVSMSGSSTNNITRMEHNVVHELGHSYDITRHYDPRNDMPSRIYENRGNILRPNDPQGRYDWQQNLTLNPSETFADMFIAWTYNVWNSDPINIDAVTDAQAWMTGMMK